jgi:hypothetical protein
VGLIGALWFSDVRPLVLIVAVMAGVGVVGVWSHLAHPHVETDTLDQAPPLTDDRAIESSAITAARVFCRVPIASAILLGVLAVWELAGLSVEAVLGVAIALISGLAYTRLRRARAVMRWEKQSGESALVVGSASSGTRYRVSPKAPSSARG